jgi:hypothetical protein
MICPKCGAENTSDLTTCGNCGSNLTDFQVPERKLTEERDSIESLLSKDILRMETAIQERLTKKRSILMRSFLPMTVVFASEVETASLHVSEEGRVSISKGELSKPMLVMEADHSTICAVLRSREPSISAPGPIKVTVNLGPVRGLETTIPQGQVLNHPLSDVYGYGFAAPSMQESLPVKRRHLVSVTILWAVFIALTIGIYMRGFEGTRLLNVMDFAFALIIAILLSASLLIMIAVNASARANARRR